jgi:hypothetical protein
MNYNLIDGLKYLCWAEIETFQDFLYELIQATTKTIFFKLK